MPQPRSTRDAAITITIDKPRHDTIPNPQTGGTTDIWFLDGTLTATDRPDQHITGQRFITRTHLDDEWALNEFRSMLTHDLLTHYRETTP